MVVVHTDRLPLGVVLGPPAAVGNMSLHHLLLPRIVDVQIAEVRNIQPAPGTSGMFSDVMVCVVEIRLDIASSIDLITVGIVVVERDIFCRFNGDSSVIWDLDFY